MCENINLKNISNDDNYIIQNIKKKLNNIKDNPKLIIKDVIIDLPNNKKIIHIIQDGYLLAGTKQRVVQLFLKKIIEKDKKDVQNGTKSDYIDTLLYAGSSNGFGPVATAYGAYKLGLKSKVFLGGKVNKNNRQINTLLALNAKITICNTYRNARILEFKLSNNPKLKWSTYPNYYIVPMGLNDKDGIMIDLLSKQIKKASKGVLYDNTNLRIWLVAGSGGIAQSILKAFPNAHLFILLTGGGSYYKNVMNWGIKEKNITIINNNNKFKISNINNEMKNQKLYYSSVNNYDDLIWPYVKKYGKNNDYIWNVSSDDYLFL